jgi:general stress protein 26
MNDVSLAEVRGVATALSPWAHLATVGADGAPDVVPVHPCWEGDTLWVMIGRDSVKARNVAHEPRVALHWQVTEVGDGVELWGRASLHDDLETKRRLWTGVFDYDLNVFAPGGPDESPDTIFMKIDADRVMVMKAYGMGGVRHWTKRSEGE